MIRLIKVALACTGLLSGFAGAEEAQMPVSAPSILTLADCVSLALQHNADILKAKEEIARTKGVQIQAWSSVIPRLSTSGDLQYQDKNRVESQLPGLSVQENTWQVGVRLTQPLFDGGSNYYGIKSAGLNEQAALQSLQSTIDATIFSVRQAFNNSLLNRALIAVATQNVDLLAEELHDQQSRYSAGTVTRYNVLSAEVALANARPTLINAKNNLRISFAQLAKLIAREGGNVAGEATPGFEIRGNLPAGTFTQRYEDVLRTALANRSDLQSLQKKMVAAEADTEVARAGWWPTLSAVGGYDEIGTQFRQFGAKNEGFIAYLQGSWNIFDGAQTIGKVDQAKAVQRTARINYEDARRQVELDVRTAFSKVTEALETIDSQQKNIESAEESLRLARARFDAGAGTQLDVLNSNVALTQARTNELQSRANFNNAVAELEKAMGIMTTYKIENAAPAPMSAVTEPKPAS